MDLLTPLLILLAAACGAVAIKGSVKFDLNQHLRDRRKRKEEALRSMCPHTVFAVDE